MSVRAPFGGAGRRAPEWAAHKKSGEAGDAPQEGRDAAAAKKIRRAAPQKP